MCFDTATTVILNVGTVTDIQEQITMETSVTNFGFEAISVSCELARSANVQLSIIDMIGRTHWTEKVGITSKFSKNVDVSSLRSGIYMVRIDAGNSSSVVRFMKI
jgi:hypothetical protein